MRTPRAHVSLLLVALLAACSRDEPPRPPPLERTPAVRTATPAREVFRLERDEAGGLRLSGVVATQEARALLVEEVRRRWPSVPLNGDLEVEPGAPALWVPEAMALMPYAAQVDGGGLVVRAEPGAAGGGVLSITGRVADDAALARLAADAEASVAPPFVVETPLDVGLAADTTGVGEAIEARTVVLSEDPALDDVVAAVRAAIGRASIVFRPGTAELDPASSAVVAAIAQALADQAVNAEVAAVGEGTGSSSLDRALAARRAQAVTRALLEGGVDARRVVASGDPSAEGNVTFRLSPAASE
jgi:outer membrane protein OmpA-like peptidoglycan-associated protein